MLNIRNIVRNINWSPYWLGAILGVDHIGFLVWHIYVFGRLLIYTKLYGIYRLFCVWKY